MKLKLTVEIEYDIKEENYPKEDLEEAGGVFEAEKMYHEDLGYTLECIYLYLDEAKISLEKITNLGSISVKEEVK